MTEEDQTTKEEMLISIIQEELVHNFNLETEYIGEGKLGIEEFNGYIDTEIKYEDIESLGESLCDWLRQRHDNDFSYELLSEGYELTIIVI
jgi:hypothetical protein